MPYFNLTHQDISSIENEEKIFYIDKGESEKVLFLIHGWHQNSRDCFGPIIDHFYHNYRIVAIDLPGHGKSYKGEHCEFSHNAAYKACAKLLSIIRKEVEEITVIGHSLGAFLSLKLSLIEKNKIDQMILIAPVVDFTPHEAELKGFVNKPIWLINIILLFRAFSGGYPFGDRKYIYDTDKGQKIPSKLKHCRFKKNNHPLHASLGYMRSFIGVSILPLVKNNNLPTLLIYGAEDRLVPQEQGAALAKLMPRTMLRVIPNASHSVQRSQKREVNYLIMSFFEENEKKAGGWINLFRRFRGKHRNHRN